MAYAGARFAVSALKALDGNANVIECAFIPSNVTSSSYFSTPLLLGVSASYTWTLAAYIMQNMYETMQLTLQ